MNHPSLESEKKKISLKLKLKINQYDSLLSSGRTDCKSNDTEKTSISTQTAKKEPTEIRFVNAPASTSKKGTNRTSTASVHDQRKKAKRKKTARSNSTTLDPLRSTQNKCKLTCNKCIDSVFSSFEALINHTVNIHGLRDDEHSTDEFIEELIEESVENFHRRV